MNEVAPTTKANLLPAKNEKKDLRGLIESNDFKLALSKALPKHLTADRFVRVAATAMLKTPKLMQCDRTSFINALLSLSQVGLEPDGRLAHLIPFENRKFGRVDCQLIIDYKGLVEIILRSGFYAAIHADKVCENDEFEYNCGQVTKHRIDFRKPRGDAYAYYAIATTKEGDKKCEVMPKDDIDAIRARSRAGNSGPWVTDYDEMAKKTVFRRLAKWLRTSPEIRDALDKDDDVLDVQATTVNVPMANVPAITKGDIAGTESISEMMNEEPSKVTPMPTVQDDVPYDDNPTLTANTATTVTTAPEPDAEPEIPFDTKGIKREAKADKAAAKPTATTYPPLFDPAAAPHEQLRQVIEGHGFTLDEYNQYLINCKRIQPGTEFVNWQSIPASVCKEHTAAYRGVLTSLQIIRENNAANQQ